MDGRCAAVLSAGRRCPNASLAGSRYCGLPQHQALARFDTNQVTVLSVLDDDEIQRLANTDADEAAVKPLVDRATTAFEQGGAEEPDAEEPAAEEEAAAEDEAPQAEEEAAAAEDELEEAEEEAAEAAEAADGAGEASVPAPVGTADESEAEAKDSEEAS